MSHKEEHNYVEDRDAVAKDPTAIGAHREDDDFSNLPRNEKTENEKLRTKDVSEAMGDEHMDIGEADHLNSGNAFDTTIGDPTILGPKGD